MAALGTQGSRGARPVALQRSFAATPRCRATLQGAHGTHASLWQRKTPAIGKVGQPRYPTDGAQKRRGPDGELWRHSPCVMEMQYRLNAGPLA